MKKIKKTAVVRLLAITAIVFMFMTIPVYAANASIALNKTQVMLYHSDSAEQDNSFLLRAVVKGMKKEITWSSSEPDIAEVDNAGRVIPRAAGRCEIIAECGGIWTACRVEVREMSNTLNLESITLGKKGVGSSIKLFTGFVGPSKAVKWASSDKTVATVKNGVVKGRSDGTAVITATVNGIPAECSVTVSSDSIHLSQERVILYLTENGKYDHKTLKSSASKGEKIVWSSSDESVAAVDSAGRIFAVSPGQTVVSVSKEGTINDTCIVEVRECRINIHDEQIALHTKGYDKKYTMSYDYSLPGRKLRFKSSNPKVASVKNGKITGRRVGTAQITISGYGTSASVNVVVGEAKDTIVLDKDSCVLYTEIEDTVRLNPTISYACMKRKVVWTSDSDAAEVYQDGTVKAIKPGTAVITASVGDVSASCSIEVKEVSVTLSEESISMSVGQDRALTYSMVAPEGVEPHISVGRDNKNDVILYHDGIVTALSEGESYVKVTVGSSYDICEVHVSREGGETDPPSGPESDPDTPDTCDHVWNPWEITVKPKIGASGRKTRYCAICSKTEEAVIPEIPDEPTIMRKIRARIDENSANTLAEGIMPCRGDVKALVLYIEFSNKDTWEKTADEIDAQFFDTDAKEVSERGRINHSLRTFFDYESGGRLNFDGETVSYTPKKTSTEYSDVGEIIAEALDSIFADRNIHEFDSNDDGYLDAVYFMTSTMDFAGATGAGGSVQSADYEHADTGIRLKQFMNTSNGNSIPVDSCAHETMHMMGLPDIYGGVQVNYNGTNADSIMDGVSTSVPGPMKFFLGWYDNLTEVSAMGRTDVTQRAVTEPGGTDLTVIYPNGDTDCRFVFLAELLTKEGLFDVPDVNYLENGGLRIWRMLLNLDDAYYIKGNDSGWANSPYDYLDTLSFENREWANSKVLGEHETVTPYTYPSTAYGLTYDISGSSKYIADWNFSGISIGNLIVKTDTHGKKLAEYTVDIEEKSSETEANFNLKMVRSGFLPEDSDGDIELIEITADTELVRGIGSCYIRIGGSKMPLLVKFKKNGKTAVICCHRDEYNELGEGAGIVIEAGALATSYGASNEREEIEWSIDLQPIALLALQGAGCSYDNPYAGRQLRVERTIRISEDEAAVINRNTNDNFVYNDRAYMMTVYNTATKKVTKKELISGADRYISGKDSIDVWDAFDYHPEKGSFGIWTGCNTSEGFKIIYDCYDADGTNVESGEASWDKYNEHITAYTSLSGDELYPLSDSRYMVLENEGKDLYLNVYDRDDPSYREKNLILENIIIRDDTNIFWTKIQECDNGYMLNYQAECPDSMYSNGYAVYVEREGDKLIAKKTYRCGDSSFVYTGVVIWLSDGKYVLAEPYLFRELK